MGEKACLLLIKRALLLNPIFSEKVQQTALAQVLLGEAVVFVVVDQFVNVNDVGVLDLLEHRNLILK